MQQKNACLHVFLTISCDERTGTPQHLRRARFYCLISDYIAVGIKRIVHVVNIGGAIDIVSTFFGPVTPAVVICHPAGGMDTAPNRRQLQFFADLVILPSAAPKILKLVFAEDCLSSWMWCREWD